MALIELRGHTQSSVSKFMSSLARYIQRCDTVKVNDYVMRLNSAFDDFESAHENVIKSFGEDRALCDAENDIEKEYVCSLKEANLYLNNDKAITVNSSPSMNIPKVEIRCFDGSPSDYMSFITVFDEYVGKANIDGQAKLTRLLQYTTGSARSAIDCCALIGGSKGYDEASTILEERFGDPYVITTTLLEKLTVNKEGSFQSTPHQSHWKSFEQFVMVKMEGLCVPD